MMNENAKRWAPSTPPTLQERSVGWVESSEPHRHQVKEFDPEGIVLSAQAAGLGKLAKTKFDPEGPGHPRCQIGRFFEDFCSASAPGARSDAGKQRIWRKTAILAPRKPCPEGLVL